MTAEGTVFLLHFERLYMGQMQHYIGTDLARHAEAEAAD